MNKTDDYIGAILEDISHKFSIIMEATAPIPQMQRDIADLQKRMSNVESDIHVMKAVLSDVSQRTNRHDDTFRGISRAVRRYSYKRNSSVTKITV